MVKQGTEPEILELIDNLNESSNKLKNSLLSLDVVAENLKSLLPFSKERSSKILKSLRGGITRPTRKRVKEVEDNTHGIIDAIGGLNALFYRRKRFRDVTGKIQTRRLNKSSPFARIVYNWKEKEVKTYANYIVKYLSLNDDARIMKCIKENTFDIEDEEINQLSDYITVFIKIVDRTIHAGEDLKERYEMFGISTASFGVK